MLRIHGAQKIWKKWMTWWLALKHLSLCLNSGKIAPLLEFSCRKRGVNDLCMWLWQNWYKLQEMGYSFPNCCSREVIWVFNWGFVCWIRHYLCYNGEESLLNCLWKGQRRNPEGRVLEGTGPASELVQIPIDHTEKYRACLCEMVHWWSD